MDLKKTEGTAGSAVPAPGFFSIFWLFFGISALTIGGGYVMVPVIQRAVGKKGWLPEEEFYDLFAAAQSVPGPMALNTATFVGGRVAGLRGFVAGAAGILVPPFAAILLVSSLIGAAGAHPLLRGFLDGAFAVVPGLVAALGLNMVRKRAWSKRRAVLTVLGAIALILAGSWAVPVFFLIIIVSRLAEGRGA